ncbi:M23 family metallopeptidase [Leucobacter aridicollis]|uniref:M23 family metallopeptidase n=1 Tax=Leucobacter aridicollis TaxID=283878 RepID=UPI0022058357|nr:M23 family metallopeptidase [Leucobacter aridicollis]UTX53304.1 M23 family metallopeptidase [Leucobacter aridicollis]
MAAPAVAVKVAVHAAQSKTGRNIILGVLAVILTIIMLPFVLIGTTVAGAVAQATDETEEVAPPGPPGTVPVVGDWASPVQSYIITTEWWGYYGHTGMDLAAPQETPIYAASSGTVTATHWAGQDSYGWYIVIEHAGGLSTLYGHMVRQTALKVGQKVKAGQHVGYVGSTGNSTGPHLHFETLVHGIPTDPRPVMSARGINL